MQNQREHFGFDLPLMDRDDRLTFTIILTASLMVATFVAAMAVVAYN